MSSLRGVVQVMMALLYFFPVTLNVKMNFARNYENVLNFVKVMPKILLVPFFRTLCRTAPAPLTKFDTLLSCLIQRITVLL